MIYQCVLVAADGSPWSAAEQPCDVMVLGPRGMTGWKQLMLGSASNAVAAKATLSVRLAKHFGTYRRWIKTTRSQATL